MHVPEDVDIKEFVYRKAAPAQTVAASSRQGLRACLTALGCAGLPAAYGHACASAHPHTPHI